MSSFLQNYQRQPKLFIDLPSGGKFYDDSVLQDGQTMQIPVFGMNAMDEIVLKTPDALFTGEGTAQVIKSCVPTILDPWKLVGYDIDYVLIAIRIATYGDAMPVNTSCPHCGSITESDIDMGAMLEKFSTYPIDFNFQLGDLSFVLHPLTYKQTSEFSMENYAYERELFQVDKIENDEERHKAQQQVYKKQNNLNARLAISYIKSVSAGDNVEENYEAITEFVLNNDVEFYEKLKQTIVDQTFAWNLPTFTVACSSEDCDKEYQTKVNIDYANFFGTTSLRSRNLILKNT